MTSYHTTRRLFKVAALASLAAALSACGGGGGSSPSASTMPVTPDSGPNLGTVTVNSFVDTLAPQQYLAGNYQDGNKAAAFDRINAIRTSLGLGALIQNANLDVAAQSHSDYLQTNNTISHFETIGLPGYTGYTSTDRANAAGYQGPSQEVVASGLVDAVAAVDALMASIYHRMAMLKYRPTAIGVGHSVTGILTMEMGSREGQGAPQTPFTNWPMDKATNVARLGGNEYPNPVPELNGAAYGNPISIQCHESYVLSVTAFTLVETATGEAVNVKLLTYSTDNVLRNTYAAEYVAAIVPLAPLKPNTTYTATYSGVINGNATSRAWNFTTGAN